MTQSPSNVKPMYEAITGLWRAVKPHLEHLPKTTEEWQQLHDDLYDYSGRDLFKCEMAVACYRELARRADGKDKQR